MDPAGSGTSGDVGDGVCCAAQPSAALTFQQHRSAHGNDDAQFPSRVKWRPRDRQQAHYNDDAGRDAVASARALQPLQWMAEICRCARNCSHQIRHRAAFRNYAQRLGWKRHPRESNDATDAAKEHCGRGDAEMSASSRSTALRCHRASYQRSLKSAALHHARSTAQITRDFRHRVSTAPSPQRSFRQPPMARRRRLASQCHAQAGRHSAWRHAE